MEDESSCLDDQLSGQEFKLTRLEKQFYVPSTDLRFEDRPAIAGHIGGQNVTQAQSP